MSIHTKHNHPDKTPLPGTFRAALCDPPYELHQKGDLGAANHYDLMTDERILGMGEAMKEIMAENSFCFLWVTTATVPLGIKILEAWGYRYTSFYFWAKPRLMLGNTFRNSGELLLLGVRGKGTKVAFKGQPNWGMHALQAHSRKPEETHLIAERLVGGDGPFLELFARRPAPSSKHWDFWGNECDATISLAKWGYPVPADSIPAHAPATVRETQV
jgi:N6-adenosine-specific RNA methylase IME4